MLEAGAVWQWDWWLTSIGPNVLASVLCVAAGFLWAGGACCRVSAPMSSASWRSTSTSPQPTPSEPKANHDRHHRRPSHPRDQDQRQALGRHVYHDPRSLSFPAEQATQLTSVRHASAGLPLNQGQVGSCTGNALCGALNTRPHWTPGQPTLAEPDALEVYSAEEVLEGVGPYPPNAQGGSGTEVCQAAKNMGWLSSYQHAFGLQAALAALVLRPVIIGIDWLTSFDTPSSAGLISIQPNATVRGGHELDVDEIDVENKLIGGWQSWGSADWPRRPVLPVLHRLRNPAQPPGRRHRAAHLTRLDRSPDRHGARQRLNPVSPASTPTHRRPA